MTVHDLAPVPRTVDDILLPRDTDPGHGGRDTTGGRVIDVAVRVKPGGRRAEVPVWKEGSHDGVSRRYGPDWAAPPGAALEDWRALRHLPRRELADLLGLSERGLAELITGQTELTLDLVLKLQEVTGIPRRIWAVMEALYQSDRVRRESRSLDR